MNSYGSNSSYSVSQPQRNEYLQLFSGGSLSFSSSVPDQQQQQQQQEQSSHMSQQHLTQLQNLQKQSAFHTRVRDVYFSSWNKQQPESSWQGHKNPKVYEGDEVHCFNSFCPMSFRFSTHLVAHILNGECGEITLQEVAGLLRDWKALQIELSKCGKLTHEEIAVLQKTWDYLPADQLQNRKITRDMIELLVVAWEILSGNRTRNRLTKQSGPGSDLGADESEQAPCGAADGWMDGCNGELNAAGTSASEQIDFTEVGIPDKTRFFI